jgi:CheY-like chemotaxis protein
VKSSAPAPGITIQVLLVEDNAGDIRLTLEAFREIDEHIQLHVAVDGIEAMSFLERNGGNGDAPRPDLILLDLNLPRMDGREVLARVKADEELRTIPVVILTTSDAEADIIHSYRLCANAYLCKPMQLDAFDSLIGSVNDFWLTKAKLPQRGSAQATE